jgi:hypothetical protein
MCFSPNPLPLTQTVTQVTSTMAPRHPPSSSSPMPSMAPSSRHCCSAPVLQPTLPEEAHAAGLEIKPLPNQPLGAEVVGLDLVHKPITPELVSVVRKALLTHQVSDTCSGRYVPEYLWPGAAGRPSCITKGPTRRKPHSWVLPHPFLHVRDGAVSFPALWGRRIMNAGLSVVPSVLAPPHTSPPTAQYLPCVAWCQAP